MKRPIFLAGMPRTGTTWIASVLAATPGTAYFHEPFNYLHVEESAPFVMRYRRGGDTVPELTAYCRRCFSGRQRHRNVISRQPKWRRWLPFTFGRILIKDVHSLLALDWMDRQFGPRIVIVLRHPLAFADSWFRMTGGKSEKAIERLLTQPALLEDYLRPFESHLRAMDDFWSRIGAYWGACYYVALQQQLSHPEWIMVRHEDFLEDTTTRFRELCARLDLPWSDRTEQFLLKSNASDSGELYVPQRILSNEKEKWRKSLTAEQRAAVARGAAPFEIAAYPQLP
ncbi:MAG: sulfotransferase [Verrucomicrobiota bacterium]